MKKITLLWGVVLCCMFTLQAQISEPNSARNSQPNQTPPISLEEVLDRYNNLDARAGLVTDEFSAAEIQLLRGYFNTNSNDRRAVLLTEDFDDITTLPGAGYDLINVSDAPGTTDWFQGNPASFPSQAGAPDSYIGANFNNTGGSVINNFMITPPLDLENGDEIIFWSRSSTTTPGFDFPDRLEVRIDPTGADTDPANSTDVGSYTELLLEINPTLASMGYPEVWTQFTATVTGLTGTVNTRVAFRYWVTDAGPTGNNSDFIGIDSMIIQEAGTPPPPPADDSIAYGHEAFALDMYGNFDTAAPGVFNSVSTGANGAGFEPAGDIDPTNNTTAYVNDADAGGGTGYYSVDIASGVYTLIGPSSQSYNGFSFNPVDGVLYGIDGTNLYTVDKATGAGTLVGAFGIGGEIMIDIAIDGAGNAYAHDIVTDSIYTIDLTTGAATLLGGTGFDANFAQGMTWDPNTDTVYLAAFNNGAFLGELRSVNTTTGATTVVGAFNGGATAEVTWMAVQALVTNDECSGAIAMSCGDTETGDTNNYTDTGGGSASPDAWYSFTGTGDAEIVTASLCTNTDFDTFIRVYEDCTLANEIAANDDFCSLFGPSQVSFLSDGTSTYYIVVEGFGAADVGNFELTISCNELAENDLCDDAIAVGCDSVTAGSTSFATIDTGVAQDCENTGGGAPGTVAITAPGVWYTYTEAIPGLVSDITLSTCDDADFDTKISVYEGDCGTLTCVAANDDGDGCSGFSSEVTFQSDGVSTYYILVHGFGAATGDFNLSVSCAPIPPFNDPIVNSIDVDEAGLPYTDPAVPMPAATTEAGGTPAECDNAGVLGVWYNFVPEINGTATATVVSPAGYTSVTFYTAPSEDAVETELTLVDWFDNQCVPGVTTSIPVEAGQAYYVYVANHEGITDIVIDGDFLLGAGDAIVEGFTYFPNPASDALNLDAGTRSIDSATIYNILGQTVVSQDVGTSSTRLDVANLSVGTYIMKVVVEGEVGIYKIVKQ